MNKVISNYLYSVVYQILLIITPFITTPYVSRILQPTGIGVDAYILSVVQIFTIFIVLGFPIYGSRQIAKVKNSIDTSKEFWSIYVIQIIVSIITFAAYGFFIQETSEYRSLYAIHFFTLAASTFDISWFFIGREEIKKVTTRNIFVKVIGIILIFTFVNDKDDLTLYIIINSITLLIGQLIMWVPLLKIVTFVKVDFGHIKSHMAPLLSLFIPQIMIQVYGNLNKVVLGGYSTEVEVGFFNQAYKVIRISYGVLGALSQVMLPRMTKEFANGNIGNIQRYVNYNIQFVLMITLPMTLGLMALAPNFIRWFLGEEFLPVIGVLKLMSPVIILVGLANIFGVQILIATNQQNKYSFSVTIGAFLSLIGNIILVPFCGVYGTTIALLIAEGTGALIQLFYVRKYFDIRLFIRLFIRYSSISFILYVVVSYIGGLHDLSLIVIIIIQILSGTTLYLLCLIVLKDTLVIKILKSVMKKAK